MVFNGGFESAPPFTAAASSGSGWIVGTTAPSTTDATWGWIISRGVAGVSAKFDSSVSYSGQYSINIHNDGTGRGLVATQNWTTPIANRWITVTPSTTYTISCWAKTSDVNTDAVFISVSDFNSADVQVTADTVVGSKYTGTNDWTFISGNFTTGLTGVKLVIKLNNNVAGSISDAWFDQVKMKRA
jgi:hypothetical protein